MNFLFKTIFGLITISILSGCGITPEKPKPKSDYIYDKSKSEGLNILSFANVKDVHKFSDVKVSVAEINEVTGLEVGATSAAIIGVGELAGLTSSISLIDAFKTGFIIGATNPKSSMKREYTVFIIPEHLANSKSEAQELVVKSLYRSVMDTAKGRPTKPVSHKHLFGSDDYMKLDIPECGASPRDCNFETNIKDSFYTKPSGANFTLVNKPSFIKGNSNKVWVGSVIDYYPYFGGCRSKTKECLSNYNRDKEIFRSKLPQWMYGFSLYNKNKIPTLTQFGTLQEMPLLIKVNK
jgi:hypothetical protein